MSRPNPFACNRGRHLALRMLEEARPEGRPESNVVMEYVEKAIDSDDRTVLRAFCAALNDHLVTAARNGPTSGRYKASLGADAIFK